MLREEALRRREAIVRAEHAWVYLVLGAIILLVGGTALVVGRGNFGLGSTAFLAVSIAGVAGVGWLRLNRAVRSNAIYCPNCAQRFDRRALLSNGDASHWLTGLCATCNTPVLEPRPEPAGVTDEEQITLSDFNTRIRKHSIAGLCVALPFVIFMFLLAFPGMEWMKSRGLVPIKSWQAGVLWLAGFIASIIALAYGLGWIAQRYGVKCPHCGKFVQYEKPVRATGRCLACGARIIRPDPCASNTMTAP